METTTMKPNQSEERTDFQKRIDAKIQMDASLFDFELKEYKRQEKELSRILDRLKEGYTYCDFDLGTNVVNRFINKLIYSIPEFDNNISIHIEIDKLRHVHLIIEKNLNGLEKNLMNVIKSKNTEISDLKDYIDLTLKGKILNLEGMITNYYAKELQSNEVKIQELEKEIEELKGGEIRIPRKMLMDTLEGYKR